MGMQITSLPLAGSVAAASMQETLPFQRAAKHHPPTADMDKTSSDLEKISMVAFNRRLKFVVDYESKEIIVKVIYNETDKVIKVLPPEELKRLHNNIRETMGTLFDRMV